MDGTWRDRLTLTRLIPLFLLLSIGMSSYPVPVDCINGSHNPTVDWAGLSQSFGYDHRGVDFSIGVGTKVYAVMDGIVIGIQQDNRLYGRNIMLLHCDGYLSYYAHLSAISVKFGEIVHSGDVIGLSGGDPSDKIDGDGVTSGAHLHFEVRRPGYFDEVGYNINPINYLKNARLSMDLQGVMR